MKGDLARYAIVKALCGGECVSGEVLGQQLGMTRAAISKHVKGLAVWGLEVLSVPGKGYQLAKPMELLDHAALTSQLSSPARVELFNKIDSTNQYMMSQLDRWQSGDVCLAELQTAGKGRRGKAWVSPFGCNLYMSMYWRFEQGIAATMGSSLTIGLAVAETLGEFGVQATLKWPNDVYVEGKKLAGILVELSIEAGGAAQLVIGVGLNMAMQEMTLGIDQPWTSLEEHLPNSVSRNTFVARLIDRLYAELERYQTLGSRELVSRWSQFDHYANQPIKLLMGAEQQSGICRGIDETGAIRIEQDGEIHSYFGGEISLRPQ